MDHDDGHEQGEITVLLRQWATGDHGTQDDLFRKVLPDLKRIAHHLLGRETRAHSFQSGDLVGQLFLRLVGARDLEWNDRRHFFRFAARSMRWYLVDYFRAHPAEEFLPIDEVFAAIRLAPADREMTMTVNTLLDELEKQSPELCELVELKFFLGFTTQEAADAMGLKLHTFERRWHDARLWLFTRMKDANGGT